LILSGKEIEKKLGKEIIIDPFNESQINPNSYNLTLHNELYVYEDKVLDMKKENTTKKIKIPDEGIVLEPGKIYLGRTVEHTFTDKFVPMLEGRSSIGRLGIAIHETAGFGDIGFNGYWTLEISCIQPVRIYPFIEICQIYYHLIEGSFEKYKSDKYQNNKGVQSSMLFKEFKK